MTMDFSRTYPGSAFTEYYTNSPALYNYGDIARNTYSYDLNNTQSRTAATAMATGMYNMKPLGTEVLSQSPWSAFTSTWDLKAVNLQQRLSGSQGQGQTSHTPKRKRKTTPAQRVAANVRERRRMCSLNTSFDKLRKRVPAFPHEKRLSRIQTLRLAMFYIAFMTEILTGQDIYTLMKQQQQQSEESKGLVWQPFDPCSQLINGESAAFITTGGMSVV